MKKRRLFLMGILPLLLAGCVLRSVGENARPEGSYQLYFLEAADGSGAAIAGETWLPEEGEDDVIQALLSALLAGPTQPGLTSPFPAGVRLLGWEQEDARLHLDLSEQYEGLSGVDQTLANYCLALTLCQVEGVESVYLTVEGAESPFLHSEELRAERVILSGAEEEPVAFTATLWFPQREGEGLGVEYRRLLLTEEDSLSMAVLSALLEGPRYESLRPVLPAGTEVLGVATEEGVCHVDLSQAFLDALPRDSGELRLLVYSIVNTVAGNVEAVESVQLRAGGEPIRLPGELSGPLVPDLTLEH